MKKIAVLLTVLCVPTFADARDCALEFADGVEYDNIGYAMWTNNAKGQSQKVGNNSFIFGAGDKSDMPVMLSKLQKINGKSVDMSDAAKKMSKQVSVVHFKCDKFKGGEYFAYSCAAGYTGVTRVGDYKGTILYQDCVKLCPDKSEIKSAMTGVLSCVQDGKWKAGDCTGSTYDKNAKAAACKQFPASTDSLYKKYKLDLPVSCDTGLIPNPENDKIYRCVTTECKSADYEIRNGYCQKKKNVTKSEETVAVAEQPAPAVDESGCEFEFDDGTVIKATAIHMIYNSDRKIEKIGLYNRKGAKFGVYDITHPQILRKIAGVDISWYIPDGVIGLSEASCYGFKIDICDTDKGYYYFGDAGVAEPEMIELRTNPGLIRRLQCVKVDMPQDVEEEPEQKRGLFWWWPFND